MGDEAPQHTKNVLPSDSTWGAYQHYGNPNTRLVDYFREKKAEARHSSSKQKSTAKGKPKNADLSKT